MPKAVYHSGFYKKTCNCPRWDSNLGPLTSQSGMLPLDHCDLPYSIIVVILLKWLQYSHSYVESHIRTYSMSIASHQPPVLTPSLSSFQSVMTRRSGDFVTIIVYSSTHVAGETLSRGSESIMTGVSL